MRNRFFSNPLLFIVLALSVLSCKKDDSNGIPDLELRLQVRPQVAGQDLVLNQAYDFDGQSVVINKFKAFVSEPSALNAEDNSVSDGSSLVIFVDGQLKSGSMGVIQENNISSLTFRFGLTAAQHESETFLNTDDEVSQNWSATDGYSNLIIEGTVDGESFRYDLQGADMSVGIGELETNLTVDGNMLLKLAVNIDEMFSGMSLVSGEQNGTNSFTLGMRDNIADGHPFELQ
jgi:hypothetical protein